MTNKLIVVSSHDPKYLTLVETIVRKEIEQRNSVYFIDVTDGSPIPVNSYHEAFLNYFRLPVPGENSKEFFEELGATCIQRPEEETSGPHLFDEYEKLEINFAIDSAIYTLTRTDRPNLSKRNVQNLQNRLLRYSELVFSSVDKAIKRYEITEVYVFNGRYPAQKSSTLAAMRNKAEVTFYEFGELKNRIFINKFSPHERLKGQQAVEKLVVGLTEKEVIDSANSWLLLRLPEAKESSNSFTQNWSTELPETIENFYSSNKVITFFTSSQDEFMSIGPEWLQHQWKDQFSAFDTVMTHFESLGYKTVLRIHPNFMTKARELVNRERKQIHNLQEKHPELLIIWHDIPINSYGLVERSSAVVVWNSTVGLEASSRGIPVFTCAAAGYDLVADVNKIWSQEDLRQYEEIQKPNSFGAYRYVASIVLRDQDIHPEVKNWDPWETQNKPVLAKISQLFVSGGNYSPWQSILAALDVWRNRGLKFNLLTIKNRLLRNG